MIRTIAKVLLVAAVTFAAPVYSASDMFLKLDGVKGETTKSKPAAPGNNVKSNEAPKPAGMLVPAIQKAQEAPTANTQKPKIAVGDVNGDGKGDVEQKRKVQQGQK